MTEPAIPAPNDHEVDAWRRLIALGAKRLEIGGHPALDVRTCRLAGQHAKSVFVDAFLNVAGRSGWIGRANDRRGSMVFAVDRSDTLGKW